MRATILETENAVLRDGADLHHADPLGDILADLILWGLFVFVLAIIAPALNASCRATLDQVVLVARSLGT